ncbi:YceI family protein [Chitinophaga sp. Hz27]|uniref:YceI family protein n=1 Tax=Chitinophaga sp. Hz27 TaxID=3347169 RepID=UPI0035DE9324
MKKIMLLMVLAVASYVSAAAQAIDTGKSGVKFSVGNMGMRKVKGTFSGMKGKIDFNPKSLSTAQFDVCVAANTVNTDNEKRDHHLKNKDFFETDKYPDICFKSSQVTQTTAGYNVSGKLTMHGVTNDVVIPFIFANNTLEGKLTIKRLDYKVGEGTNTFMVGNEVEVMITCVVN